MSIGYNRSSHMMDTVRDRKISVIDTMCASGQFRPTSRHEQYNAFDGMRVLMNFSCDRASLGREAPPRTILLLFPFLALA